MFSKALKTTLIGLATFGLLACGSTPTHETPYIPDPNDTRSEAGLIKSDLPRDTSPSTSDVQALAHDNLGFALDLYQTLKDDPDQTNLFFSPHSISTALAMCFSGARNETATDVAGVMHYNLPAAQLHPAFNALDLALQSRGQGAAGTDGQGFALHIANSIWGQSNYSFIADFLDLLAVNYDAGLHVLDFRNEPEPSRATINDWVAQQTAGLIEELLGPGTITPLTRLVLTNAIYFNAAWAEPFDPASTTSGSFHRVDGSTVQTDLMLHTAELPYATGAGFSAVELPYDGEELGMLIIVPDQGRFDEIESSLDATLVDSIAASLTDAMVAVTLPKWEATSELSLKDALTALGMEIAFVGGRADFSGITDEEPIWIDDVIHEATVTVDEEGTEAAAATAVVMVGFGMPEQMTIDRPFVYVIRDHQTGAVLFVGRVLDPSA